MPNRNHEALKYTLLSNEMYYHGDIKMVNQYKLNKTSECSPSIFFLLYGNSTLICLVYGVTQNTFETLNLKQINFSPKVHGKKTKMNSRYKWKVLMLLAN